MIQPKTKLWIYVSAIACVVFVIWLVTVKQSVKRELNNTSSSGSLFRDIKVRFNEAWQDKPSFAAPTTTQLQAGLASTYQGGPQLTKQQLDELIENFEIKINTSTPASPSQGGPTTTDLKVETPIDTSDWLTYQNEEYGFEFKHPKEWPGLEMIKNNKQVTTIFIGPNTNREGVKGGMYRLKIYPSKTKPQHYAFDKDCQSPEHKVCIPYDPYIYPDIKVMKNNNQNLHISKLGDMSPQDYIFIEGKKDGFLFIGPTLNEYLYAVVLSFNEL